MFGPGLHSSGVAGTITVSGSGIEVQVDAQRRYVSFTLLRLREVGFGHTGLELAWTQDSEIWAVHVLEAAATRSILALPAVAGLPQAQALQSLQRRNATRRTLGWSLLGLLVLSPLLLLVLFFMQADRMAGWVADRIPIVEETRFGREAFASMKGQLKLRDSGPAYAAVKNIGTRLTQGSKYTYEFHVVEDDTLNAFAIPGGIVVVHTGLIKATQRPEELAGVLAHEVQHVEQRHSVQGMVKNLGLRAVWAWVTGDLGGTLAGQAALQLTSLKFSRDAETEADEKGFDALLKQGIDPGGMPDFFKTMSEKAADAPVAFLSTHPLSESRRKLLGERVKELGQRMFVPLGLQPWPPL